MKFYKILFMMTLILGTLISISSSSWLMMWIGLEMNLMSIIPLMVIKMNFSSESSIKYFITQALASALILLTIILFFLMNNYWMNYTWSLIFNSSLLMKMGAAPFHFWFPEIMEGLSWVNSFIMLTWQKIAPMILLMYNSYFSMFMIFIIIICLMISGIQGFNQISLRKIMAYSSINHIAWMIPLLFTSIYIWIIYFLIYSIILFNMIFIFFKNNIYNFNQLNMLLSNNFSMKLLFIFNLMSLGGLPPFLGFFPKWLTLNMLINYNHYLLMFTMVLLTLITLFYYIRLSISSFMLNSSNLILTKFNHLNYWMMMNIINLLLFMMIILMYNFM